MSACQYQKLNIQVHPIPETDLMKFPTIHEPQLIGCFSLTSNRNYEESLKNLRYYMPPVSNFPLDLNQGLQNAMQKPDNLYYERLDHILSFIYEKQNNMFSIRPGVGCGMPSLDLDFVCTRDVLEMIMCTPYGNRRDWRLHATKYNNTIYICHQETLQEEQEKRDKLDFQKKIQRSWDYKLQQLCMRKSIEEVPNRNDPVNECEEFNCVYEINVGGMNILYNAEMHGVLPTNPETDLTNLKFVQLKTRLTNMSRNQWSAYKRNETLHWWCQSYLTCLKTIHVGLCNENGLVNKIDPICVRSLRKETGQEWEASACAHFLIRFMRALKEIFVGDVSDPTTVYEFCFDAMSNSIVYTIFEGRTDHTFIPDWYRLMMSTQFQMAQDREQQDGVLSFDDFKNFAVMQNL